MSTRRSASPPPRNRTSGHSTPARRSPPPSQPPQPQAHPYPHPHPYGQYEPPRAYPPPGYIYAPPQYGYPPPPGAYPGGYAAYPVSASAPQFAPRAHGVGGPVNAGGGAGGSSGSPTQVVFTDDAATKLSPAVRRRCFNCCTTDTSTWRRSNLSPGKVLCNKCGLFERTHSRPRPEQFPHKRGPLASSTLRAPGLPDAQYAPPAPNPISTGAAPNTETSNQRKKEEHVSTPHSKPAPTSGDGKSKEKEK
ncbi:hypothetical protein B0H19DRAFT_1039135 [Mycena capillaripes]|nr:hypothetical protein B0H19DRAFT_1039135 [Mycena capillaripes]